MRLLLRAEGALTGRWTPALVGVAWAAVIGWVWGGLHAPGIFHDELSYLFQARLFATGRWTVPSPPMADAFAQPHLLVAPAMASKYPPGHALLLALGELVGAPALVVLALVALRAAVTFALARRLAGGAVALLTCVLLLSGDSLRWSASYFSETTTGALLVVAWYGLLRWRMANEERGTRNEETTAVAQTQSDICRPEHREGPASRSSQAGPSLRSLRGSGQAGRQDRSRSSFLVPRSSFPVRWLLIVAAALGWCAITRPYSALLFAIPIGYVVLRDIRHTRRWRDLAAAMAVGSAIVVVLPLWSARTTGEWTLWPQTLYTRDYMPYDRPHFGVETAQPRRELPVDLALIAPTLREEERLHTFAKLPRIALARAVYLLNATWDAPLLALPLAIAGVAVAPAAAWLGIATAVTLFVGYLAHVAWPDWTIYYMEVAPVLAFLVACGAAWICTLAAVAMRRGAAERALPSAALAVLLVAPLLAPSIVRQARTARAEREVRQRYAERFRTMLGRLPAPAVLFVRYGPRHSPHLSLITNGPDWADAPIWVVPDRGRARNASVLAQATGRQGLFFDEERSMFAPYLPAETR